MNAHVRYGIELLSSRHPELKKLQKLSDQPSLHGDQIWKSSLLLMDYLAERPPGNHLDIMDVGCGWGQLGIYMAKQLQCRALLVDADPEVFAFAKQQRAINDPESALHITYLAVNFSQITDQQLLQMDMLVGADICFWDDLATELKQLLERAIACGVQRILLADPGRTSFETLVDYFRSHYNAKLIKRKQPGRTSKEGFILQIDNG